MSRQNQTEVTGAESPGRVQMIQTMVTWPEGVVPSGHVTAPVTASYCNGRITTCSGRITVILPLHLSVRHGRELAVGQEGGSQEGGSRGRGTGLPHSPPVQQRLTGSPWRTARRKKKEKKWCRAVSIAAPNSPHEGEERTLHIEVLVHPQPPSDNGADVWTGWRRARRCDHST